jgi:hypothetical protein
MCVEYTRNASQEAVSWWLLVGREPSAVYAAAVLKLGRHELFS